MAGKVDHVEWRDQQESESTSLMASDLRQVAFLAVAWTIRYSCDTSNVLFEELVTAQKAFT